MNSTMTCFTISMMQQMIRQQRLLGPSNQDGNINNSKRSHINKITIYFFRTVAGDILEKLKSRIIIMK